MFRHALLAFAILFTAALPSAASDTVHQAKVIWFNMAKGFGFIRPDDGSRDLFLHISEVKNSGFDPDTLADGMCIRYQTKTGQDGRTMAAKLQSC